MYSKETNGITLIALVITIILLLILGGVVVSQLNSGNLIGNAISVADKSKIESKKEEIQLAITSKMIEADGDITIENIIDKLEKNGIIDSGNSNSENGQVKTNPDGYVYEIVQDKNGNWNVNYVGKGEIEATKITLATSVDTTGITNKVNITATAKAKSGVKSIQLPDGTNKTYASGTTTATETYEVTQNGTYKFTATNNNNESVDKTVAISNIMEGEIAIAINPSTPTNKDVTATITWPSGNYSVTKEVSTNGGTTYTTVTGTTTQITIKANCNIRARIKTGSGEIKTKTYEITNIDKTNPTVRAKQSSVTITEGDSNELSNYFTITANGKYGIASTVYTDTSNNNAVVTNTNTLALGTHVIKCIATKETKATASATITIVVENGLAKENTTIKPDKNSNLQIVIPAGFAPVILATGTTQSLPGKDGSVARLMTKEEWNNITVEDINKGIVVVDHAITYDGGNATGTVPDFNEFVWIPITDASKFAIVAWPRPDGTVQKASEDTTTTEYTNMVTSVNNNKGFYVARYEASANSDSSKAQSKRGATPWTMATGISQGDAATKSANYNAALNSHVMYEIEWDSMLNWLNGNATISSSTSGQTKTMELEDLNTNSRSWGNYPNSTGDAATNSGSQQTTGSSEYWKANNVYDLAGNVSEYTGGGTRTPITTTTSSIDTDTVPVPVRRIFYKRRLLLDRWHLSSL